MNSDTLLIAHVWLCVCMCTNLLCGLVIGECASEISWCRWCRQICWWWVVL